MFEQVYYSCQQGASWQFRGRAIDEDRLGFAKRFLWWRLHIEAGGVIGVVVKKPAREVTPDEAIGMFEEWSAVPSLLYQFLNRGFGAVPSRVPIPVLKYVLISHFLQCDG